MKKRHFFQYLIPATVIIGGMVLMSSKCADTKTVAVTDTTGNGSKIAAQEFKQETVATGLNMPWAVAFLPDGRLLVTERTGKLRLVKDGVLDPMEITGLPKLQYRGQGGLLEVALHPDYAKNGWIYISYSSPTAEGEPGDEGGAHTALMRAKLKDHTLTDIQHLYKALPNVRSTVHFGGKIAFDNKGYVYMTLGERGKKEAAQDLTKAQGRVIRLHDDGKIPADNPFVNTAGAKPETWSYGNRNGQGLTFQPATGALWEHEHGPQGGDELNIVERGKNYGWPAITFGIDYDNSIISNDTAKAGMEQPVLYWKPSIAPSGMTFINNKKFKDWDGDLLVGSLKFNYLQHLKISGTRVTKRTIVFDKIGRVRDIRQGPDGNIYVVVEEGSIIKISPAS